MVVAALVAAVGGVIVALIQSLRKENKADHDIVQGQLKHLYAVATRTETKVDRVKDDLTHHLVWHQEATHGEDSGRDRSRKQSKKSANAGGTNLRKSKQRG